MNLLMKRELDLWSAIEKLARLTIFGGAADCWLFSGYRQPNGYGWVNIGEVKIAAHRLALIASGAELSEGMDACHHCDIRNCVNPAHLYAGSRRQNMADCTARGRHNKIRGEQNPNAVLSSAAVREIRRRRELGETVMSLAGTFGVNPATISRIARGLWRSEVA